jgi:hypothetical protein
MGLLDQPDDLQLLGSRTFLAVPIRDHALSRRKSRACSATTSFSAWASRRRLDLAAGRRPRGVARKAPLASLQELFDQV